jgi:quinol monooxygenase YgiN
MIRSVLHLRAIPGRRDELLALFDAASLRALLEEQRGLLSAELAVSLDDPDEMLLVGDWASAEQLARWADGPVPGGLLDAAAELSVAEPEQRAYRVVESVS